MGESIWESFHLVRGPRVERTRRRGFHDVPVVATCAAICGAVSLPVNGRTSIVASGREEGVGWRCQVYDLSNVYVTLVIPTGRLKRAVESIQPYPMTETMVVRGELTAEREGGIEVTVTGVGEGR